MKMSIVWTFHRFSIRLLELADDGAIYCCDNTKYEPFISESQWNVNTIHFRLTSQITQTNNQFYQKYTVSHMMVLSGSIKN